MDERVITGPDDVAEGAAALAASEPRFAHALEASGPWPDRLRPDGFPALAQAIVSQQLSVASAAAIGARVEAAGLHSPEVVLAASDEMLKECGLSRPKQRYLRALAAAGIDFDALAAKPSDEVVATLVAVPGIGIWTAEIYALFALGRADVFPAGDLALQEGARMLFDLEARPGERALRAMAEPWSPWRGVAARGLWAYYAYVKGREGIG
ncbi:DNA-3-methyladenine glycosylase 2 family protein [Palleronia sp. LCG004]|uniref:DNA-3-methyladenine glycosylase family protein n=1 Tax=Palleronia sp. LCG004 TaxID=3079304 RepID=UPI0029421699|nr:DNA-3-methyladenine glycosylase 2 family protein [Palleronia sp. LCG004]WOI54922.1 DNA-3-methyladenine glycosylase 2 family protein [Palleronia sp. LCG004]